MKLSDLLELTLLGAIWGMSFLFMRTATPEFGAIGLVEARTAIAALFLLPLVLLRKQLSGLKQNWWPILIVGLVNTAIPFCLFSYATVALGAGLGSILNATAPMFGAVVAYVWLKDQLSKWAICGLVTGFIGVGIISVARSGLTGELSLLPLLAALTATFCYGLAASYTKRKLVGVNTLAIATGSQIFAALALLPLAIVTWPDVPPSNEAWWQVIILGIACTAIAYIMYFRLISNVGAAKAITVAYLVPVFGVLWGILFLDEILTPGMLAGAALILLGVGLTTGLIKARKRRYA